MAEERIFVAIIEHQTDIRGKDFTIFKNGTSREYPLQEAIRLMCDAYFKAKDKGAMESERVVAALNALLEAK